MFILRILRFTFILTALLAGFSANAQDIAAGDAKFGAKIYLKCRSCHVLDKPTNKMGPHLMDLLGRQAASIEKFTYSQAMKDAGKSGFEWNEDNLKAFLMSPKTIIPGTSMRFWGLFEGQADDLIAYLKEQQSRTTTP